MALSSSVASSMTLARTAGNPAILLLAVGRLRSARTEKRASRCSTDRCTSARLCRKRARRSSSVEGGARVTALAAGAEVVVDCAGFMSTSGMMGSEGTVEGDGVGWDGAKEWPPRMALCVCVCEMTRLRAPGEWSETSRRSSSAPPLHQPATSEGHAEDKSSLPVSSDRRLPAYHRTIDTSIARSTSLAPVAMPPNPVSRTLSIALLIADTPASTSSRLPPLSPLPRPAYKAPSCPF